MILPCLLALFSFSGIAQQWELQKNESGIKVFTRSTTNSSFNSFRAEMTVKNSVAEVVHLLKHMDKYPNIFPDTKELKILNRPNDSTQVQYSLTDAPWPVSDRDGIYEMVFVKTSSGKGVIVRSRALPDYLPEKEDVVRIRKSQSSWNIYPVDSDHIRIEYEVSAEPGGSIPDWLANSAAVEVPFQTFVNLRNQLAERK